MLFVFRQSYDVLTGRMSYIRHAALTDPVGFDLSCCYCTLYKFL